MTSYKSNLHPILYNNNLKEIIDKNNSVVLAANVLQLETGNTHSLTTSANNLSDAVNEVNANVGNAAVIASYFSSATDVSGALVELLSMLGGSLASGSSNTTSTFSGTFMGSILATPTGYDFQYQPYFSNGVGVFSVRDFQATGSTFLGDSGSTVVKLADQPKGTSPTQTMTLTLPYNDGFESNTEPMVLAKGSKLYVYCETEAGHQDLQFNFTVEG